jgi:hypothetical protein
LAYGSKFGLGGRGGKESGNILPDRGGKYGGGGGGGAGTRNAPGQDGADGGQGVVIFIEE